MYNTFNNQRPSTWRVFDNVTYVRGKISMSIVPSLLIEVRVFKCLTIACPSFDLVVLPVVSGSGWAQMAIYVKDIRSSLLATPTGPRN